MRSAPQSTLSLAIVWMSVMISGASRFGWPLGRDFRLQTILKRSRCQRSSVSGFITCKAPPSAAQPGQDEQEQAVIVVDPRSPEAAT